MTSDLVKLAKVAEAGTALDKMGYAHYLQEESGTKAAAEYRQANGLDDPRWDEVLPHCRDRGVLCLQYIQMLKAVGEIDDAEAAVLGANILALWPGATERWKLLRAAAAQLAEKYPDGRVALDLQHQVLPLTSSAPPGISGPTDPAA
jgi:hypothetical protein